ncbi:MAG: hypothetical protein KA319_14300 [Ferruginibacter sp.]|nr:hypothetical protein [Ferruginibacter sp.]
MKQKITLSLPAQSIKIAKKYAKQHNQSVSEFLSNQLEIINNVEIALQKQKITPWVKKFAGIVNTGKNEYR